MAFQGEDAIDFIVLLLNLPHRIDPKRATTLLTLPSTRHTTVFDCIAQFRGVLGNGIHHRL
jgi:hypothetical protein